MKCNINQKVIWLILFCCCLAACFKKPQVNQNALIQQQACIDSLNLKDQVRAQTHCELCLEYDASMPECLNGLGLISLMNNDEEKALSFFTKALRQNNDYSQARNNLGVIYFSRGDFITALKYFDRTLEIDPSNIDARYNCALSHFRLGQRMRANNDTNNSIKHLLLAKEQTKKLLALDPTYPGAFRDLGLIYLNLYDHNIYDAERKELLASAKLAFSHCAEASREDDSCYEGLGQVSYEEGKYDQAFANYFLCLAYAPHNSACRANIVVVYEKSAQADLGFNNFKASLKENPHHALAHDALCAALFDRGLDEEGRKACEKAISLKPDLCSAHFRLAEYFGAIVNAEKAAGHCRSFLACGHANKSNEIAKCQEILATAQ